MARPAAILDRQLALASWLPSGRRLPVVAGRAAAGETVETVAQVALPDEDLGIPMDLTVIMRTPRDQIVTVAMSHHTHVSVDDYLVIGESTTAVVKDQFSAIGTG